MIADRLQAIRSELPDRVRLIAVSKFHPIESIIEAYKAGQRHFGENRVQEMVSKEVLLRSQCPDLQWHQIGTLQRNKVKYIAPFVSMIESVDSLRLMDEIERQAARYERKIDILLQVHVAAEETKSGFALDKLEEAARLLSQTDCYPHIRPCGVMGMATLTTDEERVRQDFVQIRELFVHLRQDYFSSCECFEQISMGMSGDYRIAIEEGSTSVRIGSAIFGERNY